jgi:hypothetical protein
LQNWRKPKVGDLLKMTSKTKISKTSKGTMLAGPGVVIPAEATKAEASTCSTDSIAAGSKNDVVRSAAEGGGAFEASGGFSFPSSCTHAAYLASVTKTDESQAPFFFNAVHDLLRKEQGHLRDECTHISIPSVSALHTAVARSGYQCTT